MTDSGSAEPVTLPMCLVLMPMYAGFEDIRERIARVLEHADIGMCRLEEELEDSAWHLWLLDSVEVSDMVLVDLTDHNPFVMYELGMAHHRRLPTAFIMNTSDGRLPATVRGSVCTLYSEGCQHFEHDLTEHLSQFRLGRSRNGNSEEMRRSFTSTELYRVGNSIADEFRSAVGEDVRYVDESEFRSRLTVSLRRGDPNPAILPENLRAQYLLTWILQDSDTVEVMSMISAWSFRRNPPYRAASY